MTEIANVQIIGALVACPEGVKDSWREVAGWVEDQLTRWYGDYVKVTYHDLFDQNCPPLPTKTQLPLVMVNGQLLINGGKISIPLIRKRLDEFGIPIIGHKDSMNVDQAV
jgi:hypothetical protein